MGSMEKERFWGLTHLFLQVLFFVVMKWSHNDYNFEKAWVTCPPTTYECSTMHNLIIVYWFPNFVLWNLGFCKHFFVFLCINLCDGCFNWGCWLANETSIKIYLADAALNS